MYWTEKLMLIGVFAVLFTMLYVIIAPVYFENNGEVLTDVIVSEKISCTNDGMLEVYMNTNYGRINISSNEFRPDDYAIEVMDRIPLNTKIDIRLTSNSVFYVNNWMFGFDSRRFQNIENSPCVVAK